MFLFQSLMECLGQGGVRNKFSLEITLNLLICTIFSPAAGKEPGVLLSQSCSAYALGIIHPNGALGVIWNQEMQFIVFKRNQH